MSSKKVTSFKKRITFGAAWCFSKNLGCEKCRKKRNDGVERIGVAQAVVSKTHKDVRTASELETQFKPYFVSKVGHGRDESAELIGSFRHQAASVAAPFIELAAVHTKMKSCKAKKTF